MRRLSAMEKGILALSALFIIFGTVDLIYPREVNVFHPSDTGGYLSSSVETSEHVSKERSRVYGGLAILFGLGIGAFAMYRERA